MIGKISMTPLFTVTGFPINPGLPNSFPWLATQAQGWDTYRFNSLTYVFYTRVGSNAAGAVILGPEYDASDTNPVSEQVLSSYADSRSDVIHKNIRCSLRPGGMHALGPKKFIRGALLSPNQDIKTYDAGIFYVGTVDGLAMTAGALWVEYDVTLSNPQSGPSGNGANYQRYAPNNPPGSVTGTILGPNPLDKSLAIYGAMVGNTFTFTSAGRFNIDLFGVTSGTFTLLNNVLGAGAVALDYGGSVGSGTTKFEDVGVYDVIVGSTIQWPVVIAGTAAMDLNITPLNVRTPYS